MMHPSSTAEALRKNRRHDIDPVLVRAQVKKTIENYEQQRDSRKQEAQQSLDEYERTDPNTRCARWSARPRGPGQVEAMYESWIAEERNYYALVRVIELATNNRKRFVLVYGDTNDATVTSATGPFESFDLAANWFLNSGR